MIPIKQFKSRKDTTFIDEQQFLTFTDTFRNIIRR